MSVIGVSECAWFARIIVTLVDAAERQLPLWVRLQNVGGGDGSRSEEWTVGSGSELRSHTQEGKTRQGRRQGQDRDRSGGVES